MNECPDCRRLMEAARAAQMQGFEAGQKAWKAYNEHLLLCRFLHIAVPKEVHHVR